MKKIHFIRANKSKHGGAEVYLSRLSDELEKQQISHSLIHSHLPKILFSWLRVLLFNQYICKVKKESDFYFSLERISCPDIYRAGDGVHKVFLEVENKSKWNPLHKVYVLLEEKCFNNATKIIANSIMIKKQIIDTYNISEEKIAVIHNGIKLETIDMYFSQSKLQQEFQLQQGN
jgi:UDP-glucose:(heptosyl)LPS alpha-1,3-glucosyltransferase